MSGGSKFSAEVPKGDAWGVEAAVAAAVLEFEETGRSPAIPCICVIGIKSVSLTPGDGDSGPARVATVVVRRIESLTTKEAIRAGQKLILKALGDRNKLDGNGAPMLPFEQAEILGMAFGNLSVTEIEQDEREKIEDENIDEPERLRRHLKAVHGVTDDEMQGMEWVDVTTKHSSDHDALEAGDGGGLPDHTRDWWAWRRVDLEAAEAESDGTPDEPADGEADTDDEQSDTPAGEDQAADAADDDQEEDDDTDDGQPDNVTPMFRDAKEAEG